MKLTTFLVAAIAGMAGVAIAAPQGNNVPDAAIPQGCSASLSGHFEIAVVKMRSVEKRGIAQIEKRNVCGGDATLVMAVKDGILTDAQWRTGYIASNFQFQFDAPVQSGTIFNGGFSVCDNGTLALGGSAVWYQCKSGEFYNVYDRHWADQCEPIFLGVMPCGEDAAKLSGEGNPDAVETVVATTQITVVSNGQAVPIQTTIPIPMCQINDGQVQAHLTPCAEINIPIVTIDVPTSPLTPVVTTGPTPPTSDTVVETSTLPTVPEEPTGPTQTPPSEPSSPSEPSAPPAGAAGVLSPNSLILLAIGLFGALFCL